MGLRELPGAVHRQMYRSHPLSVVAVALLDFVAAGGTAGQGNSSPASMVEYPNEFKVLSVQSDRRTGSSIGAVRVRVWR